MQLFEDPSIVRSNIVSCVSRMTEHTFEQLFRTYWSNFLFWDVCESMFDTFEKYLERINENKK